MIRLLDVVPSSTMVLPGSNIAVDIDTLHVQRPTRANLALVRFPPGWQRPGTGWYPCAEEFVVLRGAIVVGPTVFAAGCYAYLPPLFARTDTGAPDGCLALAYFSATPRWLPAPPAAPHAPDAVDPARADPAAGLVCRPPSGILRVPSRDVPGCSSVVTDAPHPLDTDADILNLHTGAWHLVRAGEEFPRLTGPTMVRQWPESHRSDTAVLDGSKPGA